MDYGRALTFVMDDPRWQQKGAIGVGVMIISVLLSPVLIGVIGFLIVMGYCVRLLQNVRDGVAMPLPEWDQWGDDLMRGFKLAVVNFVWALPIILFSIPTGIGSALVDPGGSDAGSFIGMILLICGGCFSMLYGLFVAVVTPGFTIGFARDEQIKSGLQWREIWGWTQENIGQVVVVALIFLVAAFALSLLGGIVGVLLCIVGLIITIPLATLVTYFFQYHLYGQLANLSPMDGVARIVPAPITPPSEMAPGVVPPPPPADEPSVSATGEYPGSGIEPTAGSPDPDGDATPPPAA